MPPSPLSSPCTSTSSSASTSSSSSSSSSLKTMQSSSTSTAQTSRHPDSPAERKLGLVEPSSRVQAVPTLTLCLMLLVSWILSVPPGSMVLAAQNYAGHDLNLWIDERQVMALTGYDMRINIIEHGIVSVYVSSARLTEQLIIPPEVDTVNLTWKSSPQNFWWYVFENFTSLDQHLLYEPLLGIPSSGYIPSNDTVFQITIPCKGKEKGVASLQLGLNIYDKNYHRLRGTPIKFRLKKQCEAFVTSSLCKQGCRNGGTCNPHGICECPQGFRGRLCDIALCSPPCQNNGTCVSPSTCACPPGYKGDYCEKAVCGRICQNGGHCLKEGFCWCQPGFFGDGCEIKRKDDTERPRRSKEPEAGVKVWTKKPRASTRKKGRKNLDIKLRKTEQRLLKILSKRAKNAQLSAEDKRVIRRLGLKAEMEGLSLRERRRVIKLLTGMRKNLTSKDKIKLQRFRGLIRKWRNKPKRQKRKKRPKKRRVYVK